MYIYLVHNLHKRSGHVNYTSRVLYGVSESWVTDNTFFIIIGDMHFVHLVLNIHYILYRTFQVYCHCLVVCSWIAQKSSWRGCQLLILVFSFLPTKIFYISGTPRPKEQDSFAEFVFIATTLGKRNCT